jgi:hypothetical protein
MTTTVLGNGETIAKCPNGCDAMLHVGKFRQVFCPTCQWTKNGKAVSDIVLCCTDCGEPLAVIAPLDGSYCTTCNYAPSMQDTFFKDRR